MRRKYYLLWLRLGGRDLYLIWSSVDEDGQSSIFLADSGEDVLLLDDSGRLKHFFTPQAAREFAIAAGIPLTEERPVLHDLDELEADVAKGSLNAKACLMAWNLYVDLARSVSPTDTAFLSRIDKKLGLYGKLCRAAGVPCDVDGSSISWTPSEHEALRELIALGQQRLRNRLGHAGGGMLSAQ